MSRTNRTALTMAMLAVMLGGCGGSQGSATAHGATPTSSPAPSPAESRASVQQYAGLVNTSTKKIRETERQYRAEFCAVGRNTLACNLAPMNFDADAKVLAVTLSIAQKPGASGYIGKPPAEIERLVTITIADAQALSNAVLVDGKAGPDMAAALSRLMSTLDRWDPYI